MQWSNERSFVRYLLGKLHDEGFKTTRIESGATSVGIPDIYYVGHGTDGWIECKFVKKNVPLILNVPWRPGQQAWMLEYYKGMYQKKKCWTFVGMIDSVVCVPMDKFYEDNDVDLFASFSRIFTHKEFSELKLREVLL